MNVKAHTEAIAKAEIEEARQRAGLPFSQQLIDYARDFDKIPESGKLVASKALDDLWCHCDKGESAIYVADNTPGAAISKHHWICVHCHKIVQVG